MSTKSITLKALMEAGCHFGHLRGRWHPNMQPYVYVTRDRVRIIDLEATKNKLKQLLKAIEEFVAVGQTLVLVGTKRQAKDIIETVGKATGIPYVSERWLGGTLTNFQTMQQSIKKMNSLTEYLASDAALELTKKERLMQQRELDRMQVKFGGLKQLRDLPDGLFIIDPSYEANALKEAKKTGLTVFAMLDTNSDPRLIDEFVPANDDAAKSIMLITNQVQGAIERGLKRQSAAAKQSTTVKATKVTKATTKIKTSPKKVVKKS